MEQVKEPMKEEREHALAIACRIMAGISPVSLTNSHTQHPFPTPSPFSFSGSSTRQTYRPSLHHSNLFLRFLVLLFSFISALALATSSTKNNRQRSPSFTEYPELIYCFSVAILAFFYAAFQLFKGISDIAHRGILISDMTSDYLSFVSDQAIGGLPSHLICFGSNINPSMAGWAKHATLEGNRHLNYPVLCNFSGYSNFCSLIWIQALQETCLVMLLTAWCILLYRCFTPQITALVLIA
ncbi:hypothetical protein V6N13_115915 [Hibiscus sabdariffa]